MGDVVITCTNDNSGGGLYLWSRSQRALSRKYSRISAGIAILRGMYVVASRSLHSTLPWWEVYGRVRVGPFFPHSLVCLDKWFNIISEAPVAQLGMGDLHDVVVTDDLLWVVDTVGNRVVGFEIVHPVSDSELPFGDSSSIRPVLAWRDPVAEQPDASHINSLCVHNERFLVSVFGRFSTYRGYELRGEEGCILDITDRIAPYGSEHPNEAPEVLYSGIADPHSLCSHGGDLYYIESRRSRVMRNGETLVQFEAGYLRGLMVLGESLLIGRSSSRHSFEEGRDGCEIYEVSLRTGDLRDMISVPSKEIYTFAPSLLSGVGVH